MASGARTTHLLPRTATYALRVAACLAALDADRWIPSAELSLRTQVPSAYASKVLRQLVDAGIVEARKGWHGGYRLASAPELIRVEDLLAAVGEPLEATHCVFGIDACNSQHPCPLHGVWSRFKEGAQRWARESTLADVGPCPSD